MNRDVVICGGGLVGCTLACALAEEQFSVTIVEAKPRVTTSYEAIDPRVSSITRGSESLLRSLGVWDRLPSDRIQPFRQMRVWDRSGVGEIVFDSAEIAEPHLGHIVENKLLERALREQLESLDDVMWLRPAELHSLVVDDGVLLVAGEHTVRAELVVGADGARSRTRDLCGIESTRGSYGQSALVTIVECARGHGETAWQRFLPSGPLAVLPLSGAYACIVWSQTSERSRELLEMTDAGFAYELGQAIGDHLGDLISTGPRYAFALEWMSASEYVRDRVALVGDAAHTIHPLAGQGVNLGLYDAAVLAQVMTEARAKGRDPARRRTLRKYERWRRGHNQLMQAAMDGFFRLFGSDNRALSGLRNTGLSVTNRLTPAKRFLMRHASGLAGDLPKRARTMR